MFQNRNTLAHRLGKTTHVSPLRIKLKSIGEKYPLSDARCFEDWLLELANARGARVVFRPNSALGKFVSPDLSYYYKYGFPVLLDCYRKEYFG